MIGCTCIYVLINILERSPNKPCHGKTLKSKKWRCIEIRMYYLMVKVHSVKIIVVNLLLIIQQNLFSFSETKNAQTNYITIDKNVII